MDEAIRRRIRQRIAVLGWTQDKLAEKTETPVRTVGNRLTGTTMPAEWVARVAVVTDTDPAWLLWGEGDPVRREPAYYERVVNEFRRILASPGDAERDRAVDLAAEAKRRLDDGKEDSA